MLLTFRILYCREIINKIFLRFKLERRRTQTNSGETPFPESPRSGIIQIFFFRLSRIAEFRIIVISTSASCTFAFFKKHNTPEIAYLMLCPLTAVFNLHGLMPLFQLYIGTVPFTG